MKKTIAALACIAFYSVSSSIPAQASTEYYVYQKNSECIVIPREIPDESEKKESIYGPDWLYIGKAASNHAAHTIAEEVACEVQNFSPFPFFFF